VDKAADASGEIERLLKSSGVAIKSIAQIPFTLEDIFISLVEEPSLSPSY
jgi:hypothetical protein